jgi:hypothetical protein
MHVLMHASVTHPDMLRSLRPRWQPISQRKLINKYHSLTHLTHSLTHSLTQVFNFIDLPLWRLIAWNVRVACRMRPSSLLLRL